MPYTVFLAPAVLPYRVQAPVRHASNLCSPTARKYPGQAKPNWFAKQYTAPNVNSLRNAAYQRMRIAGQGLKVVHRHAIHNPVSIKPNQCMPVTSVIS